MKTHARTANRPPPPVMIDMAVGSVFGGWTTIASPVRDFARRRTSVMCRCVCGKEKDVLTKSLRNALSASCGCVGNRIAGIKRTTHGHARGPEYRCWNSMKQRCHNPRAMGYFLYGGRGISVCERWRVSFSDFLSDMGPRPEGHTLERIDNDGDYGPGNCRWATHLEQMRNTRRNVFVKLGPRQMSVSEAAGEIGVPAQRIYWRAWKKRAGHQEAVDHYTSLAPGNALSALVGGGAAGGGQG